VPLTPNSRESIESALKRTPDGRFMLALLDAASRAEFLQRECDKRLVVIDGLKKALDARESAGAPAPSPEQQKPVERGGTKPARLPKGPWALRHPRKAIASLFQRSHGKR